MMDKSKKSNNKRHKDETRQQSDTNSRTRPKEIGGPKGPEPTRYGDWEKKGRCIDF